MDPRVGGLLDGAGSGGPDELRSIVLRAGRRRTRLTAVAAGLALAAGGGMGYGIASATGGGGSSQQIVATGPVSGPTGASAAYGAEPAIGGGSVAVPASKFQSLFTRQVGAVDIRGFLLSSPKPMPYQGAYSCFGGPGFQAEVSTPHMVGIVPGFDNQESVAGPISYTQPSVIGQPEGDPTVVVVAYTASDVAQVKMTFTDGSVDQMAPVQGWSAFAARGEPKSVPVYGTMTAFDHAGKALETVSVRAPEPTVSPMGSGSGGSSGSGAAGTGSAGTGSAGSGTVHAADGAVTSPPASVSVTPPARGYVAYPCRVGPPVSPQPCTPPTTVNGTTNACVTPLPAGMCNAPASPASGSSSAACSTKPLPPATSGTTVAPNSGSGG